MNEQEFLIHQCRGYLRLEKQLKESARRSEHLITKGTREVLFWVCILSINILFIMIAVAIGKITEPLGFTALILPTMGALLGVVLLAASWDNRKSWISSRDWWHQELLRTERTTNSYIGQIGPTVWIGLREEPLEERQ